MLFYRLNYLLDEEHVPHRQLTVAPYDQGTQADTLLRKGVKRNVQSSGINRGCGAESREDTAYTPGRPLYLIIFLASSYFSLGTSGTSALEFTQK